MKQHGINNSSSSNNNNNTNSSGGNNNNNNNKNIQTKQIGVSKEKSNSRNKKINTNKTQYYQLINIPEKHI